MTLTNDGDIDGVFSVARTIVSDTGTSLTPSSPFAARLNLKIEDDATGTVYYDDLLSSMSGAVAAGTIAPSATRTYKFTVTFLDGGPNGADNKYKGASVEANFNWEAVNN